MGLSSEIATAVVLWSTASSQFCGHPWSLLRSVPAGSPVYDHGSESIGTTEARGESFYDGPRGYCFLAGGVYHVPPRALGTWVGAVSFVGCSS